jgi:hypothetical protein
VDPEKHVEGQRFPIARLLHYESKSNFLSLLPKNRPEPIVLYNDGVLEIEQKNPLLNDDALRILNVREVNAVLYRRGRYIYPRVFWLLNLLSIAAAFFSIIMMEIWMHAALWGIHITPLQSASFFALFIPIMFDIFRDKLVTPEELEFTFDDGKPKKISGDLPEDSIHRVTMLVLCLTLLLVFLMTGLWAEEHAPQIGDIIIYSLICLTFIAVAANIWNKVSNLTEEAISGISSFDIPHGLSHMYFATMSIRSSNIAVQSKSDITSKELDEIRERLLRHEEIISSIVSANDIFAAPSPSLGVLAIRVSTETIMRHACDNVGIQWKPNARPTLETYMQSYGSKQELDSRIRSYLGNIREMGNRAAHDFNLDWDEFKITLNQFCEIVGWYSVNFSDTSESE